MPNTNPPPSVKDERFDDWAVTFHRNTTTRKNWTPTLAFATPGDSAFVYSTRVAELFYGGGQYHAKFTIACTCTHTTSSGALSLSGLPVAANSDSGYTVTGTVDQWTGITYANATQWACYLLASGTTLGFVGSASGQANRVLDSADIPTGGTLILRGTIMYR